MIIGQRTCRGCGCTDNNACMTDDGPCSWVLMDVDCEAREAGRQPTTEARPHTGICSACAEALDWHPVTMLQIDERAAPERFAVGGLR